MTLDLDFRNTNSLWASVLVETLVRAGVRRAVVSPGSRSTPLTMALARHSGIEAIPVLDERSAGFFALGLAKADLRPVVLVCTSGTAAANYFPAIIEAQESGVPLLVITADRPPELRACASGQTIDQQKIYGGYVSFYHELAVPELDLGRLRYLRQTVLHAVTRTRSPQYGPVHLNAPFRDPLPPLNDGGAAAAFGAKTAWDHFFLHIASAGSESAEDSSDWHAAEQGLRTPLPIVPDLHGLIVVGANQPANRQEFVAAVGEMARRLGWPVLADGLSPIRSHATYVPHLVTTYDAILRHPATAERLLPEVVLCVGGWPTSKVLRTWLEKSDAAIWLVSDRMDNRDALHGRTTQVNAGLATVVASLPVAEAENGYQRMWTTYEARARTALDQRIEAATELVEPKAIWLLARNLPPQTPLFVANSMPVRDLEYVWPPGDQAIRPLCNRGANGIDGTLSTAIGLAHGSEVPGVLLTGDLALLHDTNGFLLRPKLKGSLTVVVVNNRGGGIFEHLPVAQFNPPFEEYFATPQEVDFAQLAAAYGASHVEVRDWAHFTELVTILPESGIRLLELKTDCKRDADVRKRWFNELAAVAPG